MLQQLIEGMTSTYFLTEVLPYWVLFFVMVFVAFRHMD